MDVTMEEGVPLFWNQPLLALNRDRRVRASRGESNIVKTDSRRSWMDPLLAFEWEMVHKVRLRPPPSWSFSSRRWHRRIPEPPQEFLDRYPGELSKLHPHFLALYSFFQQQNSQEMYQKEAGIENGFGHRHLASFRPELQPPYDDILPQAHRF